MTAERLSQLQDAHAFNPAPRRDEMFQLHVPFDDMTGTASCERALDLALRRGQRVAVVGVSGAGKSSVTATVLGPLAEGLAPVPIPVTVEQPEIATDPTAFAAHLVRVVARLVEAAAPKQGGRAQRINNQLQTGERSRLHRATVGTPTWMLPRAELSYELKQAAAQPPINSIAVIDQARQLLELIAGEELQPVLVLDDTDKWLNTAWQSGAQEVRAGFFGRVIRLMAEELACAAAVAVHTDYLADPDYQAAQGFMDVTVHLPQVPDTAGVGHILARRAALALGLDETGEASILDGLVDDSAIEVLYTHYTAGPSNLRRGVLDLAQTALARACDDDAYSITAAHVVIAITERS